MEKQPLFEARTRGYHVYRIPGLCVTPKGAVLATSEARRGGGGDWDLNDVVIRRSTDGARTWDDQRVLVEAENHGEGPISNFCMIPDAEENCTHAVYCHNYARIYYRRSDDDGVTFTEAREITEAALAFRDDYPWRVIATGPGHGLKTSTGRLVIPVWMSDGSGTEFGAGKLGHRPSNISVIYSDDGGATWAAGAVLTRNLDSVPYAGTAASVINPSEASLMELADGRIYINARSESPAHRRVAATSPDGAREWSAPRFDDGLLDTVCMASTHSVGDSHLFVAPDNLEQTMMPGGHKNCDRKRLTAKLSTDDCRTWAARRVIEEGPAGYSDLAVLGDGTILCLYECGQVSRMYDDKYCMLARFDRAWVEAG